MKNKLKVITLLVTTISTALPTLACTFNHYADEVKDKIMNDMANQTSVVIKSLIFGKEKSADTTQVINDMFNQGDNFAIKNKSKDNNDKPAKIDNWSDFQKQWGEIGKIITTGFDPNQYIVKGGDGKLTKQINTSNNTNNLLKTLNSALTLLRTSDNKLLASAFLDNVDNIRSLITGLINQLKSNTPESITDNQNIITFLKNSIIGNNWSNNPKIMFQENVINPLKMLFNNLIDCDWDLNGTKTPTNYQRLKAFMESWKDDSGNYYSNWVVNNEWSFPDSTSPLNSVDYNFYRAGVLISHLLYQIGDNYQLFNPDPNRLQVYHPRYLGDIISDHLNGNNEIDKFLFKDINNYLDKLLKNPKYILDLIQAATPIIKQLILKSPNIFSQFSSFSAGNKYPTNYNEGNYNFSDVIKNIVNLLNDKNQLNYIITNILTAPEKNNFAGKAFLYDVRVKINIVSQPVALPLPLVLTFSTDQGKGIINTVVDFLTSNTVKSTINSINELFTNWSKQYNEKNTGIKFDLRNISDFLVGAKSDMINGVLNIFNTNVIKPNDDNKQYGLFNIITSPNPINESQYENFYVSLGGQLKKDGAYPGPFRDNSVFDLLINNLNSNQQPLGKLFEILYGNNNERLNFSGISDYIIKDNNEWVKKNYTDYFDINNASISSISNESIKTVNKNNQLSNYLTYEISYKINGSIFKFLIKGVDHEDLNRNFGERNFSFLEIKKL